MACQSTQSSSTNSVLKELTSNDLALLCNTLNPVASKCLALGLQLGLKESRIQTIRANNRNDCEAQLCEIISDRLKQESPLTWHDIITALRSLSVHHPDLARQIESQYISPTSDPRHENTESFSNPTAHTHTSLAPPSSANSVRPLQSQLPKQCPSQPTQPVNTGMYTPFPSHPSFQSYPHYQPPLPHFQIHSHIPLQHTSRYPLSNNPVPQWPHCHPLHIPPSSIHQSVSSSDHSSSRYTSAIPHEQPPSTQPGWGTHYGYPPHMYPHLYHPNTPPIPQPYPTTPHILAPTTRPLQQEITGQWDSESYMYHALFETSHAQSQRSSIESCPPPAKELHLKSNPELPPTQSSSCSHSAKGAYHRSPIDAFVHYIKDCYKQCEIEMDPNVLKWPPTPSKIFINLACIDWESVVSKEEADEYTRAMVEDGNVDVIMKEKRNIDFDDIVRDLPPVTALEKVVLVEGAPGVGKSTFAWEFCRRWERGDIAQKYQLVLLLKLRDERMSRAKNLEDLIYHPDTDVSNDVKHDLVHSHGVNTLIILEGFDELPDSQRKGSSIFLQLILGQLLMHATIMITSRHWATGEIMRRIEHRVFQHIEVLGFTERNVVEYVKSVFTGRDKKTASSIDQSVGGTDEMSEKAKKNIDDVMAYLHTYPQIKACMYIPLNAAIIVSIYQDSKKGKCILPKTLTELYYALTQILLLRYLYGNTDYKDQEWNIDSFEKDLPDKVYSQLLTICKVAYDGVCTEGRKRVQLIFSDRDLGGCETLGFMQSVAEVCVMHGRKMSHNFLHLTVQEFLAALCISTMSSAEQLKHFHRHKDGRLRVVLRFLSGLTKLNKVTPDQLMGLLGQPKVEQSDEQHISLYRNPIRPDVCVSANHSNWLFEAQNSELLQSLFQNYTASFTFTREMLPLEYYSVGYCIIHSHSQWSLVLDQDIEKEKLHMLVSGAKTGDGDYRVALKTTSMTPENVHILVNSFSSNVEELYYLKIPDNGNCLTIPPLSTLRILELQIDNSRSAFDISCDLSFSSLESLIISSSRKGTTLSTKTCEAIGKLLSSTTSLKEFCLSPNIRNHEFSTHVTDNDVGVITKGLSYNLALPVKSLDIDCKCTFTTTATRFLVQFITRSTTLQYLKIYINAFESVDIFAKGLSDNIALPLKSLCIDCKCIFTTTATRSLAQFIARSTILQYIRIYRVTFSAQGLIELTEAIHHCSRLQEKKLEQLSFRLECSEDVVNLRYMIKDHPDVQKSITDWDGVTNVLSFSIRTHHQRKPSILNLGLGCNEDKSLKLVNMSISDSVTLALAQALYHNSTLEVLDLSYNNVSDAGVVALAQTFHSLTLSELYLCNNSISDVGAVALAQALHHNYTLQVLDLSGNDTIGKEGTHQLVQALTVNTSIIKVTMFYYGGGLILPRRCEKYATQCTLYNTVKDRIRFL